MLDYRNKLTTLTFCLNLLHFRLLQKADESEKYILLIYNFNEKITYKSSASKWFKNKKVNTTSLVS